MSKIGRNDPCPCGSGKKYKKCCRDIHKSEDHFIFPEISSLLHMRCIKDNLFNESNTKYDFNRVFTDFCRANELDVTKINTDIQTYFELFEKYIEELIISHCCKYSSYELFYWHRRIHPIKQYGFSNYSIYSYYELIKVAIFSFGTKQDVFTISKNTKQPYFVPRYLELLSEGSLFTCDIPNEVIMVLCDLYKLENICSYYIYLRNCKRVAIKGGSVITDPSFGFSVIPNNDEINNLINLYDKRSNSQTLLSHIGTYSNEKEIGDDELVIICLQSNFDKIKQAFLKNVNFKYNDDTPNFFFGSINLHDYYQITKGLNSVLHQKLGFEIEDLLSILVHISNTIGYYLQLLIIENNNPDFFRAFHLVQRGYLLMEDTEKSRREYVDAFIATYKDVFSHKGNPIIKNILAAFNYLFFRQGTYSSLENELLKGFLFAKVTRDKIIIDCTGLPSVLTRLLENFKSIDGKFANTISSHLEDIVNIEVQSEFGVDSIFCRGEITNKSGEKKEIDCSFIYMNYLFIIECKSLSVSEGSILGESGAINFRKKKLIEFIDEVEKKVDFIISNKTNLSIEIPSNITHIVSFVVTSFTEYIWVNNEELFFNRELPRIMTLDEIKQIKQDSIINNLVSKPFVKAI